MTIAEFRQTVSQYYREHGRSFLWRETTNPYAITVSELMLQQTQTERVMPKYEEFLRTLPDWQALAKVDTKTLLELWQGLGYNRRALNLKRMAQEVVQNYDGILSSDMQELQKLPGIGAYTAGAICAFAYNQPVVMIETNIRRAFIHHFFADREGVSDKELLPLIAEALDAEHPREWYWALMDYGAMLAKQYPNANTRSKHYTKQSQFKGSLRQLRGEILRVMTKEPRVSVLGLLEQTGQSEERIGAALLGLEKDGFIARRDGAFELLNS